MGAQSAPHLKTARAYRLRLAFPDIYAQPSRGWDELTLDRWLRRARRRRLEPMKQLAATPPPRRHLRWFDSAIANGLIEGVNSLAAKAKARG